MFLFALLRFAQAGGNLEFIQAQPKMFLPAAVYGALIAGGLFACVFVMRRLALHPIDWAAQTRALANMRLSPRFSLLFLGVAAFLWAAGGCAALLMRRYAHFEMTEAAESLIHGLCFQVFGLLILAGYLRARAVSWNRAFGADGLPLLKQVARAAVCYMASMPLLIAVGLMSRIFFLSRGYRVDMQDVVLLFQQQLPPATLGALLFMAIVLAPVFEEILFRGIVLRLVAGRLGLAAAVALASFVFAAAHLHLPSFPQLFVLAAVFSLAYVGTGSLATPIIMHALFNSVGLALMWLAPLE